MIFVEIVVAESVTGVFLEIQILHSWSINIYFDRRIVSTSTVFLKIFAVNKTLKASVSLK